MIFNSASCVALVLPLRKKGLAKRSLQPVITDINFANVVLHQRCVAPPQLPSVFVKLLTTFLGANVPCR